MHKNLPPTTAVLNPCTPSHIPARIQRKIAVRWQEWAPQVWIDLQHRDYFDAEASAELERLRQEHAEHLLTLLMRHGIRMRQVRRHELDDPMLTDQERRLRVRNALERKQKAFASRCRAIIREIRGHGTRLGRQGSAAQRPGPIE